MGQIFSLHTGVSLVVYRIHENVYAYSFIWRQTTGITSREVTRIEPVGRSAKAPEKKTDECHKTNLTCEMFCYKRKKIHEELKKNGNMAWFMTLKGQSFIRGHYGLLYDPRSQ